VSDAPGFDPVGALRRLVEEGVRFVVIGGFGANLLGSPSVTYDLDVCYARDPANLEALARALRGLRARLRGAPADVAFQLDAKALELGDRFTFATSAGPLDVMGTPAGVDGFGDLDRTAQDMDLGGFTVRVAALEDLIRMKRAVGRPKDRIHLEVLGSLRAVVDARAAEQREERRRRKDDQPSV
jgi:hypothetical protein